MTRWALTPVEELGEPRHTALVVDGAPHRRITVGLAVTRELLEAAAMDANHPRSGGWQVVSASLNRADVDDLIAELTRRREAM